MEKRNQKCLKELRNYILCIIRVFTSNSFLKFIFWKKIISFRKTLLRRWLLLIFSFFIFSQFTKSLGRWWEAIFRDAIFPEGVFPRGPFSLGLFSGRVRGGGGGGSRGGFSWRMNSTFIFYFTVTSIAKLNWISLFSVNLVLYRKR